MKSNILIFGTGFISGQFISAFNNERVRLSVIFNKHKFENIEDINQYSVDTNIDTILDIESPEYILITHGRSVVSENADVTQAFEDNFIKIVSALDKISKNKATISKLKKILIIGSASEYGSSYEAPISEDFKTCPVTIYGLSKSILHSTFEYYIRTTVLPIVYVRQFNVAGYGQRDDFAISSFARQMVMIEKMDIEPVLKVGNTQHERDFVDIRDVCFVYMLLLEKGIVGEVYNVGSGRFISIEDILEKVVSLSTVRVDVSIESNPSMFGRNFALSSRIWSDITKLRNLGFEPKFSIDETIKSSLDYWRESYDRL